MREAGISRGIWNGIQIRQEFPNNIPKNIAQFSYLFCYLDIKHIYHWKNKLKKKVADSINFISYDIFHPKVPINEYLCVNDTQYTQSSFDIYVNERNILDTRSKQLFY